MPIDPGRILTEEGQAEVAALGRRHGVAPEAVLVLLRALERGGGDQAQFSHPDLGGMGQWSRHGMIMVGDMFNDTLKARVDGLCRETAALLARPGLMQPHGRDGDDARAWWPASCGRPSATGAQNEMRYACFPQTRRLAIARGDRVELYDTGEHRIHGVSQQQGRDDLRFTSQLGTVVLHELERIDTGDAGRQAPRDAVASDPGSAAAARDTPVSRPPRSGDADVLDVIERLHGLQRKGVLSEAEFAEKKKELLGRL